MLVLLVGNLSGELISLTGQQGALLSINLFSFNDLLLLRLISFVLRPAGVLLFSGVGQQPAPPAVCLLFGAIQPLVIAALLQDQRPAG